MTEAEAALRYHWLKRHMKLQYHSKQKGDSYFTDLRVEYYIDLTLIGMTCIMSEVPFDDALGYVMKDKQEKIMDGLHSALHNGVVSVKFTKVDGTTRDMKCTLAESIIPAEQKPIGAERTKHEGVTAVFDTDIGEWRSFRNNSVISWSIGR